MQEINLRNYAYLGDAVWELYIRNKTILQTNNAKKTPSDYYIYGKNPIPV